MCRFNVFHEAKEKNLSEVVVCGTGKLRRDFLFSDDLAEACLVLMENCDSKDIGEFLNIGTGNDLSLY